MELLQAARPLPKSGQTSSLAAQSEISMVLIEIAGCWQSHPKHFRFDQPNSTKFYSINSIRFNSIRLNSVQFNSTISVQTPWIEFKSLTSTPSISTQLNFKTLTNQLHWINLVRFEVTTSKCNTLQSISVQSNHFKSVSLCLIRSFHVNRNEFNHCN